MPTWFSGFSKLVDDLAQKLKPKSGGSGKRPAPIIRVDVSKHLPSTASLPFKELMEVYRELPIEFPQLKAITAAQWALESGWGTSALAKDHNNYAGAKWRHGLEPFGRPVTYKAWDGVDTYAHFNDEAAFIQAYWKRLDMLSAYRGWRDHVATGEDFIQEIGPTWVAVSPSHGREYVKRVISICNERTKPIFT